MPRIAPLPRFTSTSHEFVMDVGEASSSEDSGTISSTGRQAGAAPSPELDTHSAFP
jgi:hypothetical protein